MEHARRWRSIQLSSTDTAWYAPICKDMQRYAEICRDMQRYSSLIGQVESLINAQVLAKLGVLLSLCS